MFHTMQEDEVTVCFTVAEHVQYALLCYVTVSTSSDSEIV